MAYTNFTLLDLKKKFQLTQLTQPLFSTIDKVAPSEWLKTTLRMNLSEPLLTEKERSERIISPILFELRERNQQRFAIYSGLLLEVDKEQGLSGECDFVLAAQPASYLLETPIFCLVEAKDNDLKAGLPQCLAQMLGAQLFNQREHHPLEVIYGCVTTGETWHFLKLEDHTVVIDLTRYYLNQVEELLGVLQKIVDFYKLDQNLAVMQCE